MQSIKTAISNINIEESTDYNGLTLFPLSSEAQSPLSYLLLEDGLWGGLVSIREVSSSGSVPELTVENRADQPTLIVDGEELVGAKQNRVANLTMLLPARQTTTIPVSCVEQGRWAYDAPDFAVSSSVQYARGRAEKLRSVHREMRASGTKRSNQSEVWNSIAAKSHRMSVDSPTEAMSSIFDQYAQELDNYAQAFTPGRNQIGALFVMNNRSLGLDLFDQAATFARFLPKLVRSYAIDALERRRADSAAPATGAEATAFLDHLSNAPFEDYPGVGLGRDAGAAANGLIAGALVVDDAVAHLTAFSELGGWQTESDPGRRHSSYQQRRRAMRHRYAAPPQRPESSPEESDE